MAVNLDKRDRWQVDSIQSVKMYNEWFIRFAPIAYSKMRDKTAQKVEDTLKWTNNLTTIEPDILCQYPEILPILRMTTAPPIARDRLIGLAGISKNLVENMELKERLPPKMTRTEVEVELRKAAVVFEQLADRELFPWLADKRLPSEKELYRATIIVADRLCGAATDPIVRNAQEQRQLALLSEWLNLRGYKRISNGLGIKVTDMEPGTYALRMGVMGMQVDSVGIVRTVNIPIDTIIMPLTAAIGDFPLLLEAKSAGDFTNTNKKRKEEATKLALLETSYGKRVRFVLFLCGYFDLGYLNFEASEGIDWIWEHRIDDLVEFGV